MKKLQFPVLILLILTISLNFQSCSSPTSQEEAKAESPNTTAAATSKEAKTADTSPAPSNPKAKDPLVQSDIDFINDKLSIIDKASDYKVDSTTVVCNQREISLERRYTNDGELRYLLGVACGDHGCVSSHHYFWDNNLIFILRENYFYADKTDFLQEHRTYFKNESMLQCLAKETTTAKGYEELKRIAKNKASNTIDCKTNIKTSNLQELISLDLQKAKEYLCK